GALAIRDILASLLTRARYAASGDDAQHLTALARGTRLAVGHHALRGRDDHGAHAAEDLRQLILAAVNPQTRAADALEAVDDGAALEIFQPHRQARLAAIGIETEVADVALLLQHLDDGGLEVRGSELHFALARSLAVADACQQVGNGVSHAHGPRPLPARLGETRDLTAACDLADLHPREPELAVYAA